MDNDKRLQIIFNHIKNGVEFFSTDNVYIDETVRIGKHTVIFPDQHIRGNTVIGNNCVLDCGNVIENSVVGNGVTVIKSVLRNAKVGDKTTIGPFANIHTNSDVGKECRVGNFVEIKNATVGQRVKTAHLAYVGDVDVGDLCNVGCGSIFVNYDGKNKHRSTVGESVFIGSNSNIIAPVNIENNAYIAAGTTVTVDLPENCMCIGRSRETVKENRTKYVKNQFDLKYFGTDGIRGIYGDTLNDEVAYLVGNFLGYSADGGKVVLGRDTRISGEKLSAAIISGITDAGADVIDLGIVPTPAVSFVTRDADANYGVMISASHNPPEYNGIKIFMSNGRKLCRIEEAEIEKHVDSGRKVCAVEKGKVERNGEYFERYLASIAKIADDLTGIKVVLDCANGSLSHVAKYVFERLGATVYSFNDEGCGRLINHECGATDTRFLREKVTSLGADVGFAFDGDADRLIAVDENGREVDGDEIIFIIARELLKTGKLNKKKVVCTVLSNMGIERTLNTMGVSMLRVDVGDHNVQAAMAKGGYVLGGEQSGHIILGEFAATGDGLLASVYLASIVKKTKLSLGVLSKVTRYPQVNASFQVKNKSEVVKNRELQNYVSAIKGELPEGRILIRKSGTEEKIRLTVEAKDGEIMKNAFEKLSRYIKEKFCQ